MGIHLEPQSSLKRKHQWILASGFYTPEPLPMHMGINRRQVYPLFRFLLRSRVGEQCWSPQNLSSIWLESCSWLVLRCEQRCPCLQRLGTSTKRADFLKEQSMEGSHLFKDVRSVRVLLVAVVTRLLRTDTIVFLQCLGTQHAEAAFVDDSCVYCECMSMNSLRSSPLFCEKRGNPLPLPIPVPLWLEQRTAG